ncbi:hypothetical protein OS21_07150 [Dickeya oryzae]
MSTPRITGGIVTRTQKKIVDGVFPLLEQALEKCSNLKAVTYELGVGISSEVIVSDLANIENSCQKMNFTPSF